MTDPRITAVEENLLEQFRLVAASGLVAREPADDVVAYHHPIAFPLFNALAGARFGDDLDRARALVAAYVDRGLPFLWWTTPSTRSPAIDTALREVGADCEETPGMHAPLDGRIDPRPPEGLTVEPVTDRTWPEFLDLLEEGFGFPPGVVGPFGEVIETVGGDHFQHVVARRGREPVGAGTLFVTDRVAGIYNVATLEPARRRGIGRCVTAALMEIARARGCTGAVLHASEMGRGVYERLGFTEVCVTPQYVWVP